MATRFKFTDTQSVITAIEVHEAQTPASPERLYRVLLAMRVQLIGVAELLSDDKPVTRLSVCELDGARIKPARRQAIVDELAMAFAPLEPAPVEPDGEAASKSRRAA